MVGIAQMYFRSKALFSSCKNAACGSSQLASPRELLLMKGASSHKRMPLLQGTLTWNDWSKWGTRALCLNSGQLWRVILCPELPMQKMNCIIVQLLLLTILLYSFPYTCFLQKHSPVNVLNALSALLTCPHWSKHFLAFWHVKITQAYLLLFLLWNEPFPKK